MRILVAEDERDLNEILCKKLRSEDYCVDGCFDGEEALDYLASVDYDAVILDIMMPKRSGLEVVEQLRRQGNQTPVLFLTARDSIDDRVTGLDAGADDYLVKPFAFDELLARLRVMTRKRGGERSNLFTIDDLTLDIKQGDFVAILGHNGSGKTTTMRMLTGCLEPTSGDVLIDGQSLLRHAELKKQIGYLPEIPPLYPEMTVNEQMCFAAGLRGLTGKAAKDAITTALRQLHVEEVRGRLIRNLSKGYKQRVGFAMAILGDPPVLILDEPTVGLDPTQLMEVRNLILDLRRNHAIILSSHILGEISAVCDRIVIINHGEIKADDTIERLEEADNSGLVLKLKIQGSSREVPKIARAVEGVVRVDNIQFVQTGIYTYDIELENDGVRNALLSALLQHGLEVLEVSAEKKNLEQVFVKLVNQKTKHSSLEDLLSEMDEEAAQKSGDAPAADADTADSTQKEEE